MQKRLFIAQILAVSLQRAWDKSICQYWRATRWRRASYIYGSRRRWRRWYSHWTLAICHKQTFYLVYYILFCLGNDMLTSTYFAFLNECPGLNEHPLWKVENWMSAKALIQTITVRLLESDQDFHWPDWSSFKSILHTYTYPQE